MTPTKGSVLPPIQGRRIPGYRGNVSDMRTTAPDGRSAYVDDYGNMYYMDTGERVEPVAPVPTTVAYPANYFNPPIPSVNDYGYGTPIPEDLQSPMVGPNSAYGPYYELGPNGPYDTTNINDPRHPDNPNNRPQVQPDEIPDLKTPYPTFDPSINPQVGTTEPQKLIYPPAPTQSAGYLRSTGEGGYGAQAYYDEINAYRANHSPEEIQQAMDTYGVSQEDVDAAKAYTPRPLEPLEPPERQQPQYARGGLSRMLRKVR